MFPAPLDVVLSEDNVVQPDLLYVRAGNEERVGAAFISGAPDLVVEISSSSTRRLDLQRKRELYERFAVPEYWYVDLEAERVEIYRLNGGRYPAPQLRYPGEILESTQLPGFEMSVAASLALDPDPAAEGGSG